MTQSSENTPTNPSPRAGAKKYEFIDSLRGVAVLGVVMVHTQSWMKPSSWFLGEMASAGAKGVQLFFLVSALTLGMSTRARSHEPKKWLGYFARRFMRIAPMFYLAAVFYLWLYGTGPAEYAPDGIAWYDIGLTFTFLHGWLPTSINSVVPGGWSIADEMVFYLFFPLMWMYLKTAKQAFICALVMYGLGLLARLIARPLYGSMYPDDYATLIKTFTKLWLPAQVFVFAVGLGLYHLFMEWRNKEEPDTEADRRVGLNCFAGGSLLFVLLSLKSGEPLLYVISLALIIYGLALYPIRIVVNPALSWIGKVSFSVYLVHFAVIFALTKMLPEGVGIQGDTGYLLGAAVVTLASVPIASLTWLLIERSGIQLGSRLNRWIQRED